MNASLRDLKLLNDSFKTVYFITGNHDLYYRDKRDMNSMEFIRDFSNFQLIDKKLVKDDVAIVPWLVGDEWKTLKKLKSKYIFGHFELPHFKMNAMVSMPDTGTLREEHFEGVEYVFSGHFHKRQQKKNIHYIGNAFPHNYADVNDVERGAMFLEWDGVPEYVDWDECPKYKKFTLSELLDNHSELLDEYTYAQVMLNINISYEEANFIREKFAEQYHVRDLKLVPVKDELEEQTGGDITFESVDQIVLSQLDTIDSSTIEKQKLVEIYNGIII
jgi:DNA repair exonuclease SbcCD nuclease subunit